MRGVFNGYSINGASLPGWLVRAALVSAASAAAIVTPTRTTFASAFGDASVEVTLTSEHTLAARANGSAESTASAPAHAIFAGRSSVTASAVGFASVIRYVSAEAGGDGTAVGVANPADQLGESSATSQSSIVLCLAHLIRPAASSVFATLSAVQVNGDVTRYPLAYSLASAPLGRAEASIKLSGQSYFRHDGYSDAAIGTAVGFNDQDKTLLSATLGSLDFGNASAQNASFITYSARSSAVGSISAIQAAPTKTHGARSSASVIASGSAGSLKTRPGAASSIADSVGVVQSAVINHAASASASASVDSSADPYITEFGRSMGSAGAALISSTFGIQNYAATVGFGESSGLGAATVNYKAMASSEAISSGSSIGVLMKLGLVNATAIGSSGLAYALSNADKPAPAERVALVQQEPRGIEVPYENRTVVA